MTQPTGTLTKQHDGYKVVLERVFKQDVTTVWDAITNPQKLAVWFMKVEMDFVPGGKMTIYFGDPDNTVSYGEIERIEHEKAFEFLWLNDDGPDELAVWELFPQETGCKLVLTYSRLGENWAAKASAGWDIILNHLREVVEGRTEPFPYTGGESAEEKAMVEEYEKLKKLLTP